MSLLIVSLKIRDLTFHEFLKFQKDILYTNLLLDEDIHNNYKKEQIDKDYLKWLSGNTIKNHG